MIKIEDPNPQNVHYKDILPFWNSKRDKRMAIYDDILCLTIEYFKEFISTVNGKNAKYEDYHTEYYDSTDQLMDFIEATNSDYLKSFLQKKDIYTYSEKVGPKLIGPFIEDKKRAEKELNI